MATSMANKLEDLPIYHKAVAFWSAVNAILESPRLRKDRRLHEQIADANDSNHVEYDRRLRARYGQGVCKLPDPLQASLAEVITG
jgi:hypothetical protein